MGAIVRWTGVIARVLAAAVMLPGVVASAPASAGTPAAAGAPGPGAQWITLGTSGGPAVQVARSQIANALVVDGALYLFDVGNGAERQLAFAHVPERSLRAVFLTHHHIDHNAGLDPVIVTHWTFADGVLDVVGPRGTRTLVDGLVAANAPTVLAGFPTGGARKPALAATVHAVDLPAALAEPTPVYADVHIKVWAIGVDHYQVAPSAPLPELPDAVAYRIEAGGRTFVYTGDTGPSPRLVRLARGADVLVSEVVRPAAIADVLARSGAAIPPQVRAAVVAGMARNHLEPAVIGEIARAAGVGKVVLTHFVPSPEDAPDADAWTREIRARFAGPVVMAGDLDRF